MAMQDSNAIWLASFSLSLTFRNYQTQVSKQIRLSLWINGKLAYLGCALRVSLLCPFIFAAFSLAPPPGVGGPSLSSLFTAFPGFRAPLGFLRFFFAWMANTAIQKEYYIMMDIEWVSKEKSCIVIYCIEILISETPSQRGHTLLCKFVFWFGIIHVHITLSCLGTGRRWLLFNTPRWTINQIYGEALFQN